MSSALTSTANVKQGNAFFVVLPLGTAVAEGDLFDATGTALTASTANTALKNALVAGAVLRDMGKTILIPANLQTGTKQSILRKVQLVSTAMMTALSNGVAPNNFAGFNEGVNTDLPSVYIRLIPAGTGVGNRVIVASTGC